LDFLQFVKAGGDSALTAAYECERHMLHAASLEFEHPIKMEPLKNFEAEIPGRYEIFIEKNS